jgi:hypothetical protein
MSKKTEQTYRWHITDKTLIEKKKPIIGLPLIRWGQSSRQDWPKRLEHPEAAIRPFADPQRSHKSV